ncbi:Bug family tripartite tricarboxylate transporter substrate binding protein [Candidimonas nitroreducens]|uniref:MFS transporter n=1 Tax=Candidimonas nitroreducens TaxID=683354 RepID=A0A225M6A3_9BURK|nr:tripartite tricarboxylate transporter substrate binding protein [Candidimonas nitroreducens]OWT56874.1 MFS transporter [Candidimonas nitroreducens]
MKIARRQFLQSAAGMLAVATVAPLPALAANAWPDRPINYVVPFAPGGATDILGRMYAQYVGQALGVSMVVENKPGTGGSLGTAYAARAKPDGYTLVGGTISSHAINVSIYPSIGYDPVKSFTPIILTGTLPNVLVVRANSDYKTVDDLIKKARSKNDALTFGSSGVGSSQHLAGELFAQDIGAHMLHVPYKGSAPSLQALAAGDIDLLFDNITSALPLIQSGKLRALAVTSTQPAAMLPDVKPLKDFGNGLEHYEVVSWQAVFAPTGTPRPIIDKLYAAMHATLQKPEVRKRLEGLGITISGMGPDELAAFQKAEVAKWAAVAAKGHIKLH